MFVGIAVFSPKTLSPQTLAAEVPLHTFVCDHFRSSICWFCRLVVATVTIVVGGVGLVETLSFLGASIMAHSHIWLATVPAFHIRIGIVMVKFLLQSVDLTP